MKMSTSDIPTGQVQNEKSFYYKELNKYINGLSERFRAKSVIRECVYNNIVKCLLSPKGKLSSLFPSKFIYWVGQHCIVIKIAGVHMACCMLSRKNICIYEAYYDVISEVHMNICHVGRDKTIFEVNSRYS